MSVATELRSRGVRSPIIFLTSSTEHAVEAFSVDATHYLLKPYTHHCKYPTAKRIAERRACPRPYGADAGAALCRAAAILLEIQPDLSPAQVRELLCTTANGQNLDLDSALQYFREEKDSVLD